MKTIPTPYSPGAGRLKPSLAVSADQELMRNLHQDTRAVAGQRITAAGPAMRQVVQHLQSLAHDIVGSLALDIDDEADAAGVVLVPRVVKALALGSAAVPMHRHALLDSAVALRASG